MKIVQGIAIGLEGIRIALCLREDVGHSHDTDGHRAVTHGAAAAGLAPWADVTRDENALRVGDLKIGGAAQALLINFGKMRCS